MFYSNWRLLSLVRMKFNLEIQRPFLFDFGLYIYKVLLDLFYNFSPGYDKCVDS